MPFGVKVIDDLNLPTVAVFRFSDMKRTDILVNRITGHVMHDVNVQISIRLHGNF